MKTPSLGLIGGAGFVGKILRRYFGDIVWSDKDSTEEEIQHVLASNIIFIAVNFEDNCFSESSRKQLERYFDAIPVLGEPLVIVFKSTFVPGTTDYFQAKYPQHKFIYNPEFLTELTAWEDFTKPQYQLLGMTHQALDVAGELLDILPKASIREIISPRDAEVLKHAFNSYYALKVTWFNQLYDACAKLGADYETVRRLMVQNPWVGDSHSIIYHKGYRGYGTIRESKCLPKDTTAFQRITQSELLQTVEHLNQILYASSSKSPVRNCPPTERRT